MGTPAEGKLRLVVFHTTSACTGRRAEVPGASARLCVRVCGVGGVGWGGWGRGSGRRGERLLVASLGLV